MKIKVKFFASLRKQIGKNEVEMNLNDQEKVRDVIKSLNLSEKENYITMINGVHCKMEHRLNNGDVLSIFPMIAGG